MDFWDGNHPKNGRCCNPYDWHEDMIKKHKNTKVKTKELNKSKLSLLEQIKKLKEMCAKIEKEKDEKLIEKIKNETNIEYLHFLCDLSTFIKSLKITIYKKERILEILDKMNYEPRELKKYNDPILNEEEDDKQYIEKEINEIFEPGKIILNEHYFAIIKYELGDWFEKYIDEHGKSRDARFESSKHGRYIF